MINLEQSYFYLMFALRKFFRASHKNKIGEWKAKIMLLWINISIIGNAILNLFQEQLKSTNIILLGMIIVLPIFLINELIFSNQTKWDFYVKKFLLFSIWRIRVANSCVILLVALAFIEPFFLRWLIKGIPWWQ